jgi:hypothetical protein
VLSGHLHHPHFMMIEGINYIQTGRSRAHGE